MKRRKWLSKGLVVLTNKHLWWLVHTSKFAAGLTIVGGIASLFSTTTAPANPVDKIHGFDCIVPGTNQYIFSLQNIERFIHKGKGKFIIYWIKFDKKKGIPKLDKKGNVKTMKEAYVVAINKGENKFKYIERRVQFGYFLQKALENLPKE